MACGNKNCACQDTGLTTPAPCDTFLCPTPNPCSETFDACCIIYTGADIPGTNIKNGDRLCDIIVQLATAGNVGPNACFNQGTCYTAITNLQADSPTSTTVILTWTPNPLAGSYIVYYRLANVPGNWAPFGPALPGAASTVTVTGLTPNKDYEFYIVTSCNLP